MRRIKIMRSKTILLLGIFVCTLGLTQTFAQQPSNIRLEEFKLLKAPATHGLLLKQGDRLAICGDSITEQNRSSPLMEDHLAVREPKLDVTVRQYGWSDERAPGFLARMTNDCLHFKPTIATTCHGMNDHEYRAYEDQIGQTYRESSTAIIEAFKANGVRVIQGSPGCVGKVPGWTKHTNDTLMDLNLNLARLRAIDIDIAGKDGVHPGWAGHTIMAYAFLKAMGLNGDIGRFSVDVKKGKMTVSAGHTLVSAQDGEFKITSARYPFCACAPEGQSAASFPVCENDNPAKDNSIRSGMALVPFNEDLNRLTLKATHVKAGGRYKVTWGSESKTFAAEQLKRGINLAAEFPCNPFCAAFAKVDAAVAAKQAYETKQIKQAFRSPEAKTDMEEVADRTEKEHAPLAAAIRAAFVPVTHM